MTRGRAQARRGPTKGANISAGDADAVSGFLLLFYHLFLPSLERESKKGSFSFSAFLSLLWGYWDSRCCLPGRRREEAREARLPLPLLYRLHISEPFSPGKHGRGKSVGNKIQPWETRCESKAPAGRAPLADHAADTSLAKVNLSPGDTHTHEKAARQNRLETESVRCLALLLGAALCARACSLRGNTTDSTRLAISHFDALC